MRLDVKLLQQIYPPTSFDAVSKALVNYLNAHSHILSNISIEFTFNSNHQTKGVAFLHWFPVGVLIHLRPQCVRLLAQ